MENQENQETPGPRTQAEADEQIAILDQKIRGYKRKKILVLLLGGTITAAFLAVGVYLLLSP